MKQLFKLIKREFQKLRMRRKWYSKSLPVVMSTSEKKYFIKNGFYPSSKLFFNFSAYGFKSYLNDRDYKKMHPLNPPPISTLIDNKAYLPLLFQAHPEWLPEFSAYVRKGELIFFRGLEDAPKNLLEFFSKAVDQFGKLIVKPVADGGGRKIFTVDSENLNQKIKEIFSEEVILSSYMDNEAYLKEIYPHSLNTMRVVFFKTSTRENKILMIGQRFGTSISKEVDNVSSGGIGYTVNIKTGILTTPYSFQITSHPTQFDKHQDTGIQLKGYQIPDWPLRLKKIQEIVDYLDFVEYAGLDLAFTTKGIKIVEINSLPESIFIQLDTPALLDDEFRKFVVNKGYLGLVEAKA